MAHRYCYNELRNFRKIKEAGDFIYNTFLLRNGNFDEYHCRALTGKQYDTSDENNCVTVCVKAGFLCRKILILQPNIIYEQIKIFE